MRREQERWNTDMYSARVHGPSRRGDRRVARARRIGGGQGDGGGYCAPVSGRFACRSTGHFQYGYGPQDRGFGGGFKAPRFPRGGVRQSRGRRDGGYTLPDFANASVEQMARHWSASHFASPFVSLLMCRLEA